MTTRASLTFFLIASVLKGVLLVAVVEFVAALTGKSGLLLGLRVASPLCIGYASWDTSQICKVHVPCLYPDFVKTIM